MVELASFTKYYNKTLAVSDVSFVVPDSCVTGLVGLNGAGKTTILKAISAIHYGDTGSVFVNKINAEQFPKKIKSLCGFVTEQPALYPTYTVCEFLETVLKLKNGLYSGKEHLKKQELHERVFDLMNQFSICTVSSKKIKELSKGYRPRLSFAYAYSANPSVFLLDEPMSGLDPRQIIEMRLLIKKLSKNKTVIFSTHNMHEVEEVCSHVIVLHKGTVIASGTPEQICLHTQTTNFETAFMKLTATSSGDVSGEK